MKYKSIDELRIETKSELENIRFSIKQVASVALAVEESLYNYMGGEYGPALYLVSTILREQDEKIDKLMKSI